MDDSSRNDVPTDIVTAAVRHRLWSILIITAIVTGVTAAWAFTRSPQYVSTADVVVRALSGNPLSPELTVSGQTVTVAMETEADLVDSPQVAAIAEKNLPGSVDPNSLTIDASVPPNTQIVQIQVTAGSSAAAQQGAGAIAEAYLTSRTDTTTSTEKSELKRLREQSATAQKGLKRSSGRAARDDPPPGAAAQAQLDARRLATLQDRIGQLNATDPDPGSIVTEPALPTTPIGIDPLVYVIAAALLGLTCGIAVAVWRERTDDRARAGRETSLAGVPYLSALPRRRASEPRLITEMSPAAPTQDGYRRARAAIIALAARPSVIVISSLSTSDPADVVSTNVALSFASAGYRVTLVDATTGHGDVAKLLGSSRAPGLAQALVGPDDESVGLASTHGLRLLPAGDASEDSREMLAGERLGPLIERMRAESDYVIVAAPPASTADSDAIAAVGDCMAFIVSDKRTTRKTVADAVQHADQRSIPVIGVISVEGDGRDARSGVARSTWPTVGHPDSSDPPRTPGSEHLNGASPDHEDATEDATAGAGDSSRAR